MKEKHVEAVKAIIADNSEPKFFMKIFIQKSPADVPVFYKQIPWQADIDVSVPDEASADSLIQYLTKLENAASKNPKITGFNYIIPKE